MLKKLATTILVFVIAVACCSCTSGGNEHTSENTNSGKETEHQQIIEKTDGYFLKDGKTDYKLLLPDSADDNIEFAAQDFNHFLKEATGVELPVLYDGKADVDNGKYISLGDTKLFAKSGITADKSLTTSGFILKSKNDDILVAAYSSKSIIYGMQELLKYFINWEYFGTDCYRYNKNVKDIKLCNFDVREVADFEFRYTNDGYTRSDPALLKRARMEYLYDFMGGPDGQIGHNNIFYLPLSLYYDEHPKWYSEDKLNLSYVANGDERELELMIEAFSEKMFDIFRNSSEPLIMCTIYDSSAFDKCDAQKELAKKYNGSNAASIVLFLNAVNKKVKAWLASDDGKQYEREYYIVFLAYMPTEKAPAYVDDNGKVTLINGLKCDPEVVVQYAPIYQDFTHSIYEEENKFYLNNLKAWSAVSENMFVWNYSIYYPDYFVFYDNFSGIQDGFKACRDLGVKWIYHEGGASGNAPASSWYRLKLYLEMKLGWNASLSVSKLMNDWFEAQYGPVAENMKELFLAMREHIENLKNKEVGNDDENYDGRFSSSAGLLKDRKFWPQANLENWLTRANEAETILSGKNLEQETFNTIKKHIAVERLAIYYMLVELYPNELGESTVQSYKNKFRADNEFIGGTRAYQNGGESVEKSLYYRWGLEEDPMAGKTGAKTISLIGGGYDVSLSDCPFMLPTQNCTYFLSEMLFSRGTTVVMTVYEKGNPHNYFEIEMKVDAYSIVMSGRYANGQKTKTINATIGYQEVYQSGGSVKDVFTGWIVQLEYRPQQEDLKLFNISGSNIEMKGFKGKEVYVAFRSKTKDVDVGIRYLGDTLDWRK